MDKLSPRRSTLDDLIEARKTLCDRPSPIPRAETPETVPLKRWGLSVAGVIALMGLVLFAAHDIRNDHPAWKDIPIGGLDTDQLVAYVPWSKSGIYLRRNDGTDQGRLVHADVLHTEDYPTFTFSPDGRRIAYISRDGLRVRAVEGGRSRLLISEGGHVVAVRWSPVGDRIAYTRKTDFDHADIWVVRPDGTQRRILIPHAEYGAWSPDGRKMVFSRPGWDSHLYVERLEDGTQWRLSNHTELEGYWPDWAPAPRIAYVGYITSENGFSSTEIFVIDPNGKNRQRLTDDDYDQEGAPAWSPDGSRIAFTSDVLGMHGELLPPPMPSMFVVNSDGSGLKRISDVDVPVKLGDLRTRAGIATGAPVWLPLDSALKF